MIKLLIGGSPCTHWSIAQTKNRETTADGIGWELFRNYLIAKEKFQPDFFLYENNKSAAQPIKDQIARELGVDLMHINSALVSAQNRQRFYAFNWDVEQPEDRGILLRDILETAYPYKQTVTEKGYCLDANYWKTPGSPETFLEGGHARANRTMVAEPVGFTDDGKSFALTTRCMGAIPEDTLKRHRHTMVAEPVRVCRECTYYDAFTINFCNKIDCAVDAEEFVCNKFAAQDAVCLRYERSEEAKRCRKDYEAGKIHHGYHELSELQPRTDGKTNTLTTVLKDNQICEPVRICTIENNSQNPEYDSKQYRVYSPDGKATTLCANGGGVGAKTGLYAVPCARRLDRLGGLYEQDTRWGIWNTDGLSPTLTASMGMGGGHVPMIPIKTSVAGNCTTNPTCQNQIYEVNNGLITIKGKQYSIKLADGYYIIRKLTPIECERLQTMPDNYTAAVSNTQRYKGLGNGWTAEVIIHILSGALKDVPKDEKIIVLSMYDGIGTGRYCLDKMGFTNVEYHAYEIDKYAMKVAMSNYSDIIQHGDAFAVREDGWQI